MNKIIRIAKLFKQGLELKEYREKLDNNKVENLAKNTLSNFEGEDVDLSYHDQHYGWFEWDHNNKMHKQVDMNDFDPDDEIKQVRNFVHEMRKVKMEDYE